jgi:hypothetical protein
VLRAGQDNSLPAPEKLLTHFETHSSHSTAMLDLQFAALRLLVLLVLPAIAQNLQNRF